MNSGSTIRLIITMKKNSSIIESSPKMHQALGSTPGIQEGGKGEEKERRRKGKEGNQFKD